jgi:hypothetical protein
MHYLAATSFVFSHKYKRSRAASGLRVIRDTANLLKPTSLAIWFTPTPLLLLSIMIITCFISFSLSPKFDFGPPQNFEKSVT